MPSLHFPSLRSLLCLGAHADDIEIGCGGTVLRALAENPSLQVHWVVFSAAGERAGEAQASAAKFLAQGGPHTVEVLSFRDSYFPADWAAIKQAMHDLSRRVQPDVVCTHRREDRHQDHHVLAELTWNAFRNHTVLEYEIPKYEGDLGQPNLFVPLDEAICRRKIELLLECFPSQRAKPWFTGDTFSALHRLRGLECASPTRFAEAFTARKLVW